MAGNAFQDLLNSQRPLVADGAMGTTLFSLGLEGGGCPELLNIEQADLVEKVHRGFIEAGADIILTNTFGGNRRRLALHRLEERVAELNGAAVEVARRATEQANRPIAIAGSIGPTGDLFSPLGPLSHDEGVEVFTEQALALAEAGADVLWIETISSFEELNAAVEAVQQTGLPYTTTLSFDTAGHTMMGISPRALAEWGKEHSHVAAVGANCGVGPGDAVAAVWEIEATVPGTLTIAKANCGIPLYQTEGGLTYPIGPNQMGEYVDLALRSGARIIGACCGSTPDHIAAIREAVDSHRSGGRPTLEEVSTRLDASIRPQPSNARRERRRS
jgi:5-methyltetrahydrofolate--homocysteine methyltransferase